LFGVDKYHRLIVYEMTWEDFWMGEGGIDRRVGRLAWIQRGGGSVLSSEWDAIYMDVRRKARYLEEGSVV
jgi:hypothetical protein